jgi:hypothetical protein
MTTSRILLQAAVVLAGFLVLSPTIAQEERHTLVLTHRLETGEQFDMPSVRYAEYFDCIRAKKKVEIGRVVPRGLIIGADGSSPSTTILGAKCVRSVKRD